MAIKGADVKNVGLASLGAVLEYFDFTVYVYVALALGQAFFPPDLSPWLRQVQVFSIYALGYLIRPFAAIVIAHFADRIGRKRLFVFTVFLMSVPTLLMGFLPTYAQIGVAAPILLLTLRLLQGCAVGGELPSAAVFISEHAPPAGLGLASGIFFAVVNVGLLMGAGAAALSALVAGADPSLSSMSWRLPFIMGGAFGLLAAYLRRHLEETPMFKQLHAERRVSKEVPVGAVVRRYWRSCLFAIALVLVQALTSGIYFQFLQSFLVADLHYAASDVRVANVVGVLAFVLAMPLWGWLRDKIGWSWTLGIGATLSALVCVWFFGTIGAPPPDGATLLLAYIPVGIVGGYVHAMVAGLISSLFPTSIRQSGFALPYSVGTAVFTGLTPLVMAALVRVYGVGVPMYGYLVGCAVAFAAAMVVNRLPQYLGASAQADGETALVTAKPIPAARVETR